MRFGEFFIMLRAYCKIFMRGKISRTLKAFEMELRLANWWPY